MDKLIFNFKVDGQKLEHSELFQRNKIVVAGSLNYLYVKFDGLSRLPEPRFALFAASGSKQIIRVQIDEAEGCDVPFKAVKPPGFTLWLSCGDDEKLIVTNTCVVKVEPSGCNKEDISINILNSYKSETELRKAHPHGNPGDGYLVQKDLYIWNEAIKDWNNTGNIQGPQGQSGPQGATGPKGDKGEKGDPSPASEIVPTEITANTAITTLVTNGVYKIWCLSSANAALLTGRPEDRTGVDILVEYIPAGTACGLQKVTYTNNAGTVRKIFYTWYNSGATPQWTEWKAENENSTNRNILHNWYFGKAVNARGQSEYSTLGYTIDRWRFGGSMKVIVNEGYISIERLVTSVQPGLSQSIESPELYRGRQMTFSIKYRSMGPLQIFAVATSGNLGQISLPAASEWKIASTTFTVPSDTVRLDPTIRTPSTAAVGDLIDIECAKLELGNQSTLANDPPADYGEQLALCQRFQQICSTNDINPVDLRPSMRAIPTITQMADGNYLYDANL